MGLNYDAASTLYNTNGMSLYSMSTAQEYSEVIKWATLINGNAGNSFWVDYKLVNGYWVSRKGDLLYFGAIPTKDIGAGDCLSLSNKYGAFETLPVDCASVYSSLVEISDPTQTTLLTTASISK